MYMNSENSQWFFLKGNNILTMKMISGDGKSVNDKRVYFGFITSLGKIVMDIKLLWLIENVWGRF